MTTRPYVIRQGDYLTQLAHDQGFDADEVWEHPRNEGVRQSREHRDILAPGDVLHVPRVRPTAHAISGGTTNAYRARVPLTPISIVLMNGRDPIANETCFIEGLGSEPLERRTAEDGRVSFAVPIHVREVRLILQEGRLVFPVLVGHMDPITEASGVRARLQHLGYYLGFQTGEDEEDEEQRLSRAIGAFQREHGIAETGTMDDETRGALRQSHGS